MQKANFSQSYLNRIDLSNADVTGANLNGAKLWKVRLAEAKIDDKSDFKFCNWWSADFYLFKRNLLSSILEYDFKPVDNVLLKKLFEKHTLEFRTRSRRFRVHSSVREFLKTVKVDEVNTDEVTLDESEA